MAPNVTSSGLLFAESDFAEKPTNKSFTSSIAPKTGSKQKASKYDWQIVWRNVILMMYFNMAALYGIYLLATFQVKIATLVWYLFVTWYAGQGITAGAHRLWAHKSYKANFPLRLILAFCNASAFQNHIYEWVRDHRVHHKFTDTDADPHNSRRGFFFSHMGWLMIKKHEDVKLKGKSIDMSDLEKDPVVMWQKKLYPLLMPLCTFVLPTMVPCYLWGEGPWNSWHMGLLRYAYSLHCTWLVNSAAHLWGTKPYDRSISPVENIYVAILVFGEGWHNYHHAFPWDYKTSEYSGYKTNYTTALIDFFARIRWAYDLKTVKPEMIVKRVKRTGDGSHPDSGETDNAMDHGHNHKSEGEVWGWDDNDMTEQHKQMVAIVNPEKTE